MKALFRPLYLAIAATALALILAGYFFFFSDKEPERVLDRFLVGFDPLWYPIDLQGKTQEFNFFTSELLQRIAREDKVPIRLIEESTDGLFPALQRGVVDGVLSANGDLSRGWRDRFLFSTPYYDFGIVLVVAADSSVSTLADLKGKVVGTVRGPSILSGLGVDPATFIVTYDNVLQCLQRLEAGQIQAALLPFLPSRILVPSLFSSRLKVIPTVIIPMPARLAVMDDAAGRALLDLFDRALKKAREDGSYDALLKRWAMPDGSVK